MKSTEFSKGSNVKLCSALEKTKPTNVLNGKKTDCKNFHGEIFLALTTVEYGKPNFLFRFFG